MRTIERVFESALWGSRLMVLPAVVASVVAALLMILLGVVSVWEVFHDVSRYFRGIDSFDPFQRSAIAHVIGAVDAFLIATVLLIFGFGMYELFVSRIDLAENDPRASKLLIVRTLSQLKAKLAGVIVMVLVVTFLKEAMGVEIGSVLNLLGFAGAIVACSVALLVVHRGSSEHGNEG